MTEFPAPPVPTLSPVGRVPAGRNPALVHLATLAPCDGRRSRTATLAQVGTLLGCPDPEACPWPDVRGQDAGRLLTRVLLTVPVRKCARRTLITRRLPHGLLRSILSAALKAGSDLAMVQALAGHASPVTTAHYDRRPEAAEVSAQLVHVPFG